MGDEDDGGRLGELSDLFEESGEDCVSGCVVEVGRGLVEEDQADGCRGHARFYDFGINVICAQQPILPQHQVC